MDFMNTLCSQIDHLIAKAYENPITFETFAVKLTELGIDRLAMDGIRDEMSFYSKDKFVHSLIRMDLQQDRAKTNWVLGKVVNLSKLENAIKQIDEKKISTVEFHRMIFAAGIIFCHVYLACNKIFYLGHDGQCYLESY